MRSHLPIAALIFLALLVAGCQPAAEQPEPAAEAPTHAEDVAAIKSLVDKRTAADNAGDAAAAAALFTNDAVSMVPNKPVLIGKEAIQSRVQLVLDQFIFQLTGEVLEVEVAGDWAFARMTYAMTLTPKAGGEPTEDSGNLLQIYRRQPDGS